MTAENSLTTGFLPAAEFHKLRERALHSYLSLSDFCEDYPASVTRQFRLPTQFSTRLLVGRSLKAKFVQGTCAFALAGLTAPPLYSTTQRSEVSPATPCQPALLPTSRDVTVFMPVEHAGVVSAAREGESVAAEQTFAWIDLANEELVNSRPMTDWERNVTSDFIWSQFS